MPGRAVSCQPQCTDRGGFAQEWRETEPARQTEGCLLVPRDPEACSGAGKMKGWGLWLLWRQRGVRPAWVGRWAGWGGDKHREGHPLTFHVGGNRQKQIFHGLIKSFKLTKFL